MLLASGLLAALQPQRRATPLHRRDALGLGIGLAAAPHVPGVAASKYASNTKLADGLVFPLVSFGLQIYDDATAEQLTLRALEAGFRNFFASALAQNQRGFVRGVRASGIARDELFICGSVVSNRALDADTAYKLTALGCAENAEAFGTLDMIMLDYPGHDDGCCTIPCVEATTPCIHPVALRILACVPGQDEACIRAQWRAFEDFKGAGGARCLAPLRAQPRATPYPHVQRLRPYARGCNHVHQEPGSLELQPGAARHRPQRAWAQSEAHCQPAAVLCGLP